MHFFIHVWKKSSKLNLYFACRERCSPTTEKCWGSENSAMCSSRIVIAIIVITGSSCSRATVCMCVVSNMHLSGLACILCDRIFTSRDSLVDGRSTAQLLDHRIFESSMRFTRFLVHTAKRRSSTDVTTTGANAIATVVAGTRLNRINQPAPETAVRDKETGRQRQRQRQRASDGRRSRRRHRVRQQNQDDGADDGRRVQN